jgi:hypothetical protein
VRSALGPLTGACTGRDCKYRHCLPPGYVFKSAEEKTRPDEEEEVPDISEEIEEERAKLGARVSPRRACVRFIADARCRRRPQTYPSARP